MKGFIENCPVLLGSATPSLESMFNAKSGKYNLLKLTERIDSAKLPMIKLVNVALEGKEKRMKGFFSKILIDKITNVLSRKESIIILQNRKGYSTQIYCEDCGEVERCNSCSVAMVYHMNTGKLKCHYCDTHKDMPKVCSFCGSLKLKYLGFGTEKVEDELQFHFPDAKIERVDPESISKKGYLTKVISDFSAKKIDILVGTQMVSKGLDFSDVTLVGVLSAESSLWFPDFRADERTFQLLTQVSGRAGRSSKEGEVIIQTLNDKNFVLQKVLANDYYGFYENELMLRRKGFYPPFSKICLIEFRDENESDAKGAVNDYYSIMCKMKKNCTVTPPSPAVISRIRGLYRFQLVVKNISEQDPSGANMRKAVLNSFIEFNQKSRYRDVKIIFDSDPQSIM